MVIIRTDPAMFAVTMSKMADAAFQGAEAEGPGHRPDDGLLGLGRRQGDRATGKVVGVEVAQEEVGVGHRGQGPAEGVTAGPGSAPADWGPTLKRPGVVDPGDASPAGSHSQVDDPEADGHASGPTTSPAGCAADQELVLAPPPCPCGRSRISPSCRPCRRRASSGCEAAARSWVETTPAAGPDSMVRRPRAPGSHCPRS